MGPAKSFNNIDIPSRTLWEDFVQGNAEMHRYITEITMVSL
jgi:hypothetical protein